jgi:hypothetical protein
LNFNKGRIKVLPLKRGIKGEDVVIIDKANRSQPLKAMVRPHFGRLNTAP